MFNLIFHGYKVCMFDDMPVIVKLKFPRGTRIIRPNWKFVHKYRADRAYVEGFYDYHTFEKLGGILHAYSLYDRNFVYRQGRMIYPKDFEFDTDRNVVCGPGIHFFRTKKEAYDYYAEYYSYI